jgi:uncharacterized protein YjiK
MSMTGSVKQTGRDGIQNPRLRRARGAAVAAFVAAAACGHAGYLAGDEIDRSSPLYGLRRASDRPVDGRVAEPSDLAFDPSTGTFWTVSDQRGTLHRIDRDGRAVGEPVDLKGRDLEGVALDPVTGHLFAVDEAASELVEATRDGQVLGRFPVAIKGSNSGIEGIAYDPAKDGFVLVKERNPAELVFVDRKGNITSRAEVRTEDLSAVTVSPDGASILAVARFEEAVLELDRSGRRRNRLALNVPAVEGLAFDGARLFAVADLGAKTPGMLYVFSREGAE